MNGKNKRTTKNEKFDCRFHVDISSSYNSNKVKTINNYHVFRIHDYAEMSEERMRQALYPREPKGDYFVFRFDEEVSIGQFDINRLINMKRLESDFVEGTPLYVKGSELLGYKATNT